VPSLPANPPPPGKPPNPAPPPGKPPNPPARTQGSHSHSHNNDYATPAHTPTEAGIWAVGNGGESGREAAARGGRGRRHSGAALTSREASTAAAAAAASGLSAGGPRLIVHSTLGGVTNVAAGQQKSAWGVGPGARA
jgi:hypothetical protein